MAIEANIKDPTHLLKINYYQDNTKHLFPHYNLICSVRKFFLKALNCLNTMMNFFSGNAVPQCLCLKHHRRVQEREGIAIPNHLGQELPETSMATKTT